MALTESGGAGQEKTLQRGKGFSELKQGGTDWQEEALGTSSQWGEGTPKRSDAADPMPATVAHRFLSQVASG